ncbi:unnamed protein product [Vitrella brassicaformis CCMP3155]|uniref:DNA polymerase delta subunit 3 n=1 Tax=Vitrella brassicaformis (strain CCMP3155) TaxID=1169540 RepID=A0A0G4H6T0_VITBC|nr:unnamed protein product [Vitrella brassicaformis CCMP3155]|eukprot:CEM39478.1 unnamed protein product [Vitrella brassicaformis CCMP3155]
MGDLKRLFRLLDSSILDEAKPVSYTLLCQRADLDLSSDGAKRLLFAYLEHKQGTDDATKVAGDYVVSGRLKGAPNRSKVMMATQDTLEELKGLFDESREIGVFVHTVRPAAIEPKDAAAIVHHDLVEEAKRNLANAAKDGTFATAGYADFPMLANTIRQTPGAAPKPSPEEKDDGSPKDAAAAAAASGGAGGAGAGTSKAGSKAQPKGKGGKGASKPVQKKGAIHSYFTSQSAANKKDKDKAQPSSAAAAAAAAAAASSSSNSRGGGGGGGGTGSGTGDRDQRMDEDDDMDGDVVMANGDSNGGMVDDDAARQLFGDDRMDIDGEADNDPPQKVYTQRQKVQSTKTFKEGNYLVTEDVTEFKEVPVAKPKPKPSAASSRSGLSKPTAAQPKKGGRGKGGNNKDKAANQSSITNFFQRK